MSPSLSVYTNGNGSASSSAHGDPVGPPADLPALPLLPPLLGHQAGPAGPPGVFLPGPPGGPPPPFLPPDVRPAPLGGRRSPPPPAQGGGGPQRGYSPSPPHSDDYYGRYRDDRGRYDRYSRERSPDR